MPPSTQDVSLTEFLAEAAWLRRLAGRLVRPDLADDLVQDTLTQLTANPPQRADSPRGWLAAVARNAANMDLRGTQRRRAREAASWSTPDVLDPEALVARSQRLRLLARLVEALEEPFRSTVLLHYFEGRSLAEIARHSNTPSGTVRWRLKTGLQRLAEALDEEHGGDRMGWLPAYVPLGMGPTGLEEAAGTGVSMSAIIKTAAIVATLGAGGIGWTVLESEPRSPSPAAAATVPTHPRPTVAAGVATRPKLPARSASGRSLLSGPEQRSSEREALQEARLRRLGAAGLDAQTVQDSAKDAQLLGDIETMMMLEDASTLAAACAEASPPETRGMLYVTLTLIGEPDVGTLIDTIEIDPSHSQGGTGEFASCLRESLFLLSLPPPATGGSQPLALFFDTDGPHVTVGQGAFDEEAQ